MSKSAVEDKQSPLVLSTLSTEVKVPEIVSTPRMNQNLNLMSSKAEIIADYEDLVRKSQLIKSQRISRPMRMTPDVDLTDRQERRLKELEERVQQLESQNQTHAIIEQFQDIKYYVESKMQELERKIDVVSALNSQRPATGKKYDQKTMEQIIYQLNALSNSTASLFEKLEGNMALIDAQSKANQKTLQKLTPLTDLPNEIIEQLAKFNHWEDKIEFQMQKFDRRLARVIEEIVK